MRLTQRQQSVITDVAAATFGPDAKVILFGSRVDDRKLFALTIDARWARQLSHDDDVAHRDGVPR